MGYYGGMPENAYAQTTRCARNQLFAPLAVDLPELGNYSVHFSHILIRRGRLTLQPGFVGDVSVIPSTARTLTSALVHDALYTLIKLQALPPGFREIADRIFYRMLIDHGVGRARAWVMYQAVRLGGGVFVRRPMVVHTLGSKRRIHTWQDAPTLLKSPPVFT